MRTDGKNARGIALMMSLEPRRMLAGNVTVVWSDDGSFDGLLTITGDNKSNQFIVSVEEQTIITGLNGTKINGGSAAAFDFFPKLAIDTGNGDDEVEVVGLFSQLSARTGNGNDIVKITESEFVATFAFDQFEIDTGNGNDYVLLESITCFECDLHISMGNGNDTVKLQGTIFMQGLFADAGVGTIDMGRGSDTIDATEFVDYIAPDPAVIIGNETVLT